MPKDNKQNPITNLVSKLRKVVIGDTSDELQSINKSLNKLKHSIGVETKTSRFLELLKAVVETSDKKEDLSDLEKILKDFGLSLATSTEQDRLARYTEYERIIEKIPYMKRALRVLTQNICYPEDYTGKVFFIDLPSDSERYKVAKNNIENLVISHNIEKNTPSTIFNTLLYGDYFVEITIAEDILKKFQLLESAITSSWFKANLGNRELKITVESVNRNSIYKLMEAKDKQDKGNSNEKEKQQEKTVFLTFHPPHKVIKLGDQEELGYLVVGVDITKLNYAFTNLDVHGEQIEKLINSILLRIKNNANLKNEIQTREELKTVLARLLMSSKSNDIQIRYVPPELMQHFKLDEGINKFRPYGTSILYGTEYLAKIIIAIQGSIMVQRITRSVDRQVIYVDVGASRDVRKYIESVKEAIQRRRFSIDGVKIDEIPSYVSSYEYLYIPTREGRRYVEFDQWTQPGDVASRVDDLKALRDALVAAIEVPPAYIGIEENIEARATLVEQSVVFATTVMNYQRTFASQIKELLTKLAKVNNVIPDDILTELEIKFQPPLSLLVEKQANYYDNVSRIVETGKSLGIPPSYFIKRYYLLDEQELEELKVEENLKKIFAKQEGEGEEAGLGGFGGGGFEEFGGGEGGEEFNI